MNNTIEMKGMLRSAIPQDQQYIRPLAVRRRSFYRRHELAILSITVGAMMFGLWLLFTNNANLLYELSTPVMEYLP